MSNDIFKLNSKIYSSFALVVIEGLLAGSNFMVLYAIIQLLFDKGMSINKIYFLTFMVAIIFAFRIFLYSIGYTKGQIGGACVSKNIRIKLGDKLKCIPIALFGKTQTGIYINAATTEVSNYEQILTHKIGDILKFIVLAIMVCIFVSVLYLPCGIILLIATGLLFPSMLLSLHLVKIYGNRKNMISAENVSSITEYITGIQTLRAYGMGGAKNKTVTNAMKDYSDISYLYEKMVIPVGMGYAAIEWLSMPLIILVAGNAWLSGNLSVANFLTVSMIPLFLCKMNTSLFVELTSYKNLMISKNHIRNIMEKEEESSSVEDFSPSSTEIEFENVNFSYVKDEPILSNINFTIPDKSLTAIVGNSGSGKTTILNLISKYYLPHSGEIKIGGESILNVAAEKVHSYISMVDQDVFLFNDTVKNNICYAKPSATDAEIENACYSANCMNFINAMEHGLDTVIGENGNSLSGGERQRLSVARALLKDSPIILLDEATASLDIENELLVKQAIATLLKKDKTVIMIAHTLPIVKHADKILVIDGGAVIESGTHAELVSNNGKYAAMWQASEQLK